MVAYETVFIIRPDLEEEAVGAVSDQVTSLIASHDGTVVSLEKTGHRRLAYEVKGFSDGFYFILNYEGQANTTRELERFFRISENIIRYLIVKKEIRPMMRPGKMKKETEVKATPAPEVKATPAPEVKAAPAPEVGAPEGETMDAVGEETAVEVSEAQAEPAPAVLDVDEEKA